MKRRVLLATALLLAPATGSFAQAPATPATPAAPAAAGANAPTQAVTINRPCCSIWDFLGAKQMGGVCKFLKNNVMKTVLGQAIGGALSPLGKAMGLGPGIGSDAFAKEGGAMGMANKLAEEEKKAPMKVKAIKYLATLDCKCYPEVVGALLESLDDCSEMVRYEALKALHKTCDPKKCCVPCATSPNELADCCSCQCEKRVVDKLNALLLARDATGCLKEQSPRIRCLATQMIEECLCRRMAPPIEETQAPIRPREEAAPRPRTEGAPVPQASSGKIRVPYYGKSKAKDMVVSTVAEEKLATAAVVSPKTRLSARGAVATPATIPVASRTVEAKPQPVVQRVSTKAVAAKPVAAKPVAPQMVAAKPVAKPVVQNAVISKPVVAEAKVVSVETEKDEPVKEARAGRRHLFGEVFGYR